MSETLLDRLVVALNEAGSSDGNVFAPPVALLWPDKARQWEASIERLCERRHVLTLGSYDSARASGPAHWLRCVVAGTVDVDGPEGLPVVYLPGVSRDDLRSVSADDQRLAPLVPVLHRSQWFTQSSGRDWTVRALLTNNDPGLGLSVAGDDATAQALVAGLDHLLREPLTRLHDRHIDAPFVNGLLNPDLVRLLLRWIDEPSTVQQELGSAAWEAFVAQCRSDYGFDPASAGVIEAARLLGIAEGAWQQVWQRFRESPADYPKIPIRLRAAQPAELILPNPGAWPAPAAEAEDSLREALAQLKDATPQDARATVLALEEEHKQRRGYVWADLGWTPLTLALEHLAELARLTALAVPTSDVSVIQRWYADTGWLVDRAALKALSEVERNVELDAVSAALDVMYGPWLHAGASALQVAIGPATNAETYIPTAPPSVSDGEVVVFVDGLRLDVAHLLAERLEGATAEVTIDVGLAALPTVTQSAKPAVVPVEQTSFGPGEGLDARRAPDGPAAGVQVLRQLLASAGIQVLTGSDTGDPSGRAWTEIGELDRHGHNLGTRLAHELVDQVERIARRLQELLRAGWSKATVVTDHGWLLLPGGLPKNEQLPAVVAEVKKGRCARVKEGATVEVATVPWHWDNNVRIAVATGITCFEANQTYEHGGVSPQECVVPRLVVTPPVGKPVTTAEITGLKWKGLTLVVEFAALPEGVVVDLRRDAGDASSSVASVARVTGGTGKVILLVEDDDLEGQPVRLVAVDPDGTVLLQRDTFVGRNT